jgi:hypothetical protein
MTSVGNYYQPHRTGTAEGRVRRVGFELEFAGVPLETVAGVVEQHLNGTIDKVSEAEYVVKTPDFGAFRVELDWEYGKSLARERAESRAVETTDPTDDDALMEKLAQVASQVVPTELVCAPVPLDSLPALDPLVTALRELGAQGTAGSPIYAFGVHINPELPALDAATVLAYLQGFLLAQDWLVQEHEVDLTRRITPYIARFPSGYVRRTLSAGEATTMESMIDDYLASNPTRNRGLDMLPLFRHVDARRVEQAMDDPRISARPTLHYRLPNCEIEQPDWGLFRSWNLWCVVEQLSADRPVLEALRLQAVEYHDKLINLAEPPWYGSLETIRKNLLLA